MTKRETIRAKYSGLEDFVADLKMKADIQPFNTFALPRVHQLVQRSNQFNLTTIRYSEDELLSIPNGSRSVGILYPSQRPAWR